MNLKALVDRIKAAFHLQTQVTLDYKKLTELQAARIENLEQALEQGQVEYDAALAELVDLSDAMEGANPTPAADRLAEEVIADSAIPTPPLVAAATTIDTPEPTSDEVLDASLEAIAWSVSEASS